MVARTALGPARRQEHEICDACRYAMRTKSASYRNRRIMNGAKSVPTKPGQTRQQSLVGGTIQTDPTGTRRRLQALSAIGHSFSDIGGRIGTEKRNVAWLAVPHRKWLYPETAQKVRALYDELSMITSTEPRAGYIARMARRKGWVPPLCWEDEMIDDPYALPLGLTHAQAYLWFWNCATMTERIEWVLENGLAATRK